MLRELRLAVRALLRSPSFAAPAIVVLALGIGASTALFSVVYAILLNPLPYPESNRIVWLWAADRQQTNGAFAAADYDDIKERNRSFEALASLRYEIFHIRRGGEPERIHGLLCSSQFSAVMGMPALAGRTFLPADDAATPRAVLLSYRLWQERFQGDRAAVGQTILLNGENAVIVGVMPPEFRFPAWAGLWAAERPRAPQTSAALAGGERRSRRFLNIVGRLRRETTLGQAGADLERIFGDLEREGLVLPGDRARAVTLQERLVGDYRAALYVLLGAAGLVLLLACANVANLFVARALGRQRDWSLRVSLGARLPQLLRAMLAEGLVVSLSGGIVGLCLGTWGGRALLLVFPNVLPRSWEVGLHPWIAAFALAAAVFAATFASATALVRLSPGRLAESLRSGGSGIPGESGGEFLASGMVAAQVAIAIVLLATALLLSKNWQRIQNIDLGISRSDTYCFRTSLPTAKYPEARQRAEFFRQAVERITALPGVDAVAAANDPPTGPHDFLDRITLRDRPPERAGEEIRAGMHLVSTGYFRALGIRLLEGREFTAQDAADSARVMVINEKLARRFWPGESALGRQIRSSSVAQNAWWEVVGVAAGVRHGGPASDFTLETYVPFAQQTTGHMTFSVRTRADFAGLLRAIKAEIQRLDADLPVFDVNTMEGYLEAWMVLRRFQVVLVRLFSGVAVVLAVAGVYSLLSFHAARRTREIGIRMALGSPRGEVLLLILRQGMRWVLLGAGLGLCGALTLHKFAAALLPDATESDPTAGLLACALLAGIALLACGLPAWRATNVNPLIALRHE